MNHEDRRATAAADTSAAKRDSLFLNANLRRAGDARVLPVRVRNLSAGGLMAELAEPFDADAAVEVEVRGIGWISGRIAWHTEGRTGIAFDRPIDPQRARKPVGGGGGGKAADRAPLSLSLR
jgi:hypothetical protein